MPLRSDDHNPDLLALISAEIQTSPDQRIPFARYMDLVLYQSQQGYYASNVVKIGQGGDFFTSPHLGSDFAELLGEQFLQMWQVMGQPSTFNLVEMGAGQGIIANDLLKYLQRQYPDFFANLNYIIVEKAAGLIAEQQHHLKAWLETWGRLKWLGLEEIADGTIAGCLFSNELIDAFPVDQVVIQRGQIQQVFVGLNPDHSGEGQRQHPFQEILAEPTMAGLAEYFQWMGIELPGRDYPEGYRTEVNLAALDWIATVSRKLQRGYVLTIDYGYPARQYYQPARREGTLQCYYHHATNTNPYFNVGHQDLTAHVNFTALERRGEECGLVNLGFTQQALFLMSLGLGDRLVANNSGAFSNDLSTVIRRREALHQLMNPLGLGGFGVLIQAKGLTTTELNQPLKGLAISQGIKY
mgnify:CR=1 FL=1